MEDEQKKGWGRELKKPREVEKDCRKKKRKKRKRKKKKKKS